MKTEKSNEWDHHLRELQWSLNTQKSCTTGFSANELVFDFKLRDLLHNRIVDALQTYDEENEKTPVLITEKRSQAVTYIGKEREK